MHAKSIHAVSAAGDAGLQPNMHLRETRAFQNSGSSYVPQKAITSLWALQQGPWCVHAMLQRPEADCGSGAPAGDCGGRILGLLLGLYRDNGKEH